MKHRDDPDNKMPDGAEPAAGVDIAPAATAGRRRAMLIAACVAVAGVLAVGGSTSAALAGHASEPVAASNPAAVNPSAGTAASGEGAAPAAQVAGTLPGPAQAADRSRRTPLAGVAPGVAPGPVAVQHGVSLSDAGGQAAPLQTSAATVADLLSEQGKPLGLTDTVVPEASTPISDGLQITVFRTAVTTATDTVDVPPTDVTSDDPTLDKGTIAVATPGTPGHQQVVSQVTTVNGIETGRQEISRTTLTEPTPNQVHVGTKTALDVQGGRVFFHDTEFGVNWDGLAFCESTNNPHAVNNPDGYLSTYGLFQFDLPTWESVGGSGNPGDASPEEQLTRAKILYQSRGLEPWLCAYAASGPPAG